MAKRDFVRRIGLDPHHLGPAGDTAGALTCPDIWELSTGEFAVMGEDATDELLSTLPPTASCHPGERIIILPRVTLLAARQDIPKK